MIKRILAILVTGATLSSGALMVAPAASASGKTCPGGSWPSELNGRPTEVAIGMTGMALWRDGRVWKLRVSEAGRDPAVFTGTVSTNGAVVAVGSHLERGDKVVRRSRSKVAYGFTNFGAIDGLNFRVGCASRVRIAGRLNGRRLDPAIVYVGHDNHHPNNVPFTIKKVDA